MIRKTLIQTLIDRDKISSSEAENLIKEARKAFYDHLDHGEQDMAYDVCEEYFGLEPDYLDELMYS